MKARRVIIALATAVLITVGGVSAPATAAPSKLALPKVCIDDYGATKMARKHLGNVTKADVYPAKGSEYVFTLDCDTAAGDYTHLVVANAKGKVLHTQRITATTTFQSDIVKASKKSGVTLFSTKVYKNTTVYDRSYTAKWNTKKKTFTVTASAVPGYVKPVHTLSKQIRTNAPFTSVTVSAANEKRIRTFNKNADRSGQRATVCEPLTSKKAACAYMYLGDNAIDVLTFNIAPRGKGYIIGTVSSDRYTPEELGLSGQSDVTELLGELTK